MSTEVGTRSPRYFLFWYGCDALLTLASVTGTLLLAARFDGIGRWGKWEIVFMLGYGLAAQGLMDTIGGYNVKVISRRIGRGRIVGAIVIHHTRKARTLERLDILGLGLGITYPAGKAFGGETVLRSLALEVARVV